MSVMITRNFQLRLNSHCSTKNAIRLHDQVSEASKQTHKNMLGTVHHFSSVSLTKSIETSAYQARNS
jgi:hypothetical protein